MMRPGRHSVGMTGLKRLITRGVGRGLGEAAGEAADKTAVSIQDGTPRAAVRREKRAMGALTGCDLNDVSCFERPFARDPFWRLRPGFSSEALKRSLELAYMTYNLRLEPWRDANWDDFTIQIDDELRTGITHEEDESGANKASLINTMKVMFARNALHDRNPISIVRNTLRQFERSDTVKAVCMMHPASAGRYLLAIGFMGTGKRLYDWISNFRFTTQNGFHKGFYQLCTYFEQNAPRIIFPETARALGLEKLTLEDVLHEMARPNSRFTLWMAGHSQGGAVMQIFAHHLMTLWSVLPQNICGYGFASPTVATGESIYDPASYPLYHILNSDDLVPRMGATLHLGLCMEYPANEAFRKTAYDMEVKPEYTEARDALKPYVARMTDTPHVMIIMTALIQCMLKIKGEATLDNWMRRWWSVSAVDRVLMNTGQKVTTLMNRLIRNAEEGYFELTGQPMEEERMQALRAELTPLVERFSLMQLLGAFASLCAPQHHLYDAEQKQGAYFHIVMNGVEWLRPFIWIQKQPQRAVKRYAVLPNYALLENIYQLRLPSAAEGTRRAGVRQIAVGKRRIGLGEQRARAAMRRAGGA